MAMLLFKSCSRVGMTRLLQPHLLSNHQLLINDVSKKTLKMTPSLSDAFAYFRARRGPFTPEEKAKGHMMMASTHWKVERIVATSMIAIMPACLFIQNPVMETLLTTSVVLHGFWGVDGVCSDYLEKFIPWIHKVWYVFAILGFAGLVHFNYNDVGVLKAIQMVWSL